MKRSEIRQYETDDKIKVTWNVSDGAHTCTGVKINEGKCTSCSICSFAYSNTASHANDTITDFKISADCTNLPLGRNVTCEDYLPVYYPFDVRLKMPV
jgi:hypothetical protein